VTVVKERVLTEEERRRNDQINVLRQVFEQIDEDTSNNGYITAIELKQVLAKIGQNYSERQIQEMIASVDVSGDGRLGFQGKIFKLEAMRV